MARRSAAPEERFSVDELILQVPSTYDPTRLDLLSYKPFLERLCGGRSYQVEAIESSLRFFCSGQFDSTRALAADAYARSTSLKRLFADESALIAKLPMPSMLSASIDLATGTGKSFVMYAVARVMMNEGLIDKALVLCPTRTIEAGLLDKFTLLTQDPDLSNLLPVRPGVGVPTIVTADTLVRDGEICIENVHAIYAATGSSVRDSFAGAGERALLISDEAHHIYSPTGADFKRWYEFIVDPAFGFRYHLGLSGTCYIGDRYFADVIYRYGIREAIADGWVKQVYYLAEDSSSTQDEIFQKLAAQHEKNRTANPGLKPLTIAVTNNITGANALALELVAFLARHHRISFDEATDRVLVVTSSPKHAANLRVLHLVDRGDNDVEWIVSVAMLSEGWDVQNVFQIYPHEKRAFNSRLLVSQVLGRGLRRPPAAGSPIVYVFNHQKWGREVESLVASVLDQEAAVTQRPVSERDAPHIGLHQLIYATSPTGIEARPVDSPRDIRRLALRPQRAADAETRFVSATDATKSSLLTTRVLQRMSEVDDVVEDVRQRMLEHDRRTGGDLANRYSRARVDELISSALAALGIDRRSGLSQENRQMVLSAFGSLRQKTMRPGAIYVTEPSGVSNISTQDLPTVSVKVSSLASTAGLFYDENSESLSPAEDLVALRRAINSDEVALSVFEVQNSYDFKSPTNVVLTSYSPERRFVGRLVHPRNSPHIRSWVKSPDVGFYSIEYSYRQGAGRSLRGRFNPDFFIWLAEADEIHIVETKADDDVTAMNAGKLAAARDHFSAVNEQIASAALRYYFHMLTPVDFDKFFQSVRDGEAHQFRSTLEAALDLI